MQQTRRDTGVAVLHLALALDCCFWQAFERFSAERSLLVPLLLLLPILLICCGILVLQVCQMPLLCRVLQLLTVSGCISTDVLMHSVAAHICQETL